MKLEQEQTTFIKRVLDTVNIAKITNVIIDTNTVRGMDEERKVIVFQREDIPTFPFKALGMNRLDLLTSRLALVMDKPGFSIDANVSTRDESVIMLTLKCNGTKVEYRCANPIVLESKNNPANTKVPPGMRDEMQFQVQLTPDAVQYLLRSESAMKAEHVTIVSNDEGIRFELVDTNSDVFTHTFARTVLVRKVSDVPVTIPIPEEYVEAKTPKDSFFVNRYPLRSVLTLFRKIPDGQFYVGKKGMLKVVINDLDLYVLPSI